MFATLRVFGVAMLLAATGSAALPQSVDPQSVDPQTVAPPSVAPPALAPRVAAPQQAAPGIYFSAKPFSDAELLAGKQMTQAQCGQQPSAVWVVVGGTGECIAYYHAASANKVAADTSARGTPAYVASGDAASPGIAPNPVEAKSVVVFISGDLVTVNGRGEVKPLVFYGKTTPTQMLSNSSNWSRNLNMSYVTLARPGTYGSSGNHAERGSEREIAVVSAALDAIKARHNYQRLHLTGYAEGAQTAAMLMTRRGDLGCVVLASGLLSVKQNLAEHGRLADWTGKLLDPAATSDKIVRQPALRVLVMTDPDDLAISARSQTAYVRRLDGVSVQQIFSAAADPAAHSLYNQARRMTADCANGMSDDAIRQKYENKKPAEPPDADDPPLHRPDAMRRELLISETQCDALKSALWLTVDGRNLCIRYWMSTAGGTKNEALAFFDGDLGANDQVRGTLNPAAARVTAGQLQRAANFWSRTYGGPYVQIARVGTLGSSGSHLRDRRSLFEVRVAMAAIDALKAKYGWTRWHIVGQSGGGHTVAALTQQRDDIGCAVMVSGAIAVKIHHRDLGGQVGSIMRSKYDPYDFIPAMRPQPGRRMIVLTDPDDTIVPLNSQAAFVRRAKAAELPILHLLTAAGDKDFHGLAGQGLRAASDCAKGATDAQLTKHYETKSLKVGGR